MDAPSTHPESATIDLRNFAVAQRSDVWRRAAARLFPGLEIRGKDAPPAAGWIRGVPVGPAQMWTILSPPVAAHFPARPEQLHVPCISVMLQRSGSAIVQQAEHRSCLRVQQLCLIDDTLPFSIEVTEGLAEFMFLRIPREIALERGQVSADRTAVCFTTNDPGTALLAALLLKLSDRADEMDHNQGTIALDAVVQLLSIPRQTRSPLTRDAGWRSRTAISFIDSELADPLLSADRVAAMQGISRRRMDNVLMQELGISTAGLIWYRRLLRAADDLRDPRRTAQTITEIAFAVGFEHAAHFTRSFKRQYHCTPREWRMQGEQTSSTPHH